MPTQGLEPAVADQNAPQRKFNELARTWKAQRGPMVSMEKVFTHPAYQAIIGMGQQVVPFLLAELEREPDHWFWALKSITGEDPVPVEERGNLQKMRARWLEWARQQNIQRNRKND